MRDNSLIKKLRAGKGVFGTFGWEFMVPALPQIVRAAGAEFLLLDMEHSGANYETIKAQAQLCRGIGLVPLARVPANQYTYIARALDAGMMGVMAPMVGSAQEAEFIVSCTRYPPRGRRGAAFGFVHDDYSGGDVAETMRIANERTLVIVLIETAEGLRNVGKIAAVPGVDVLWLGHFDLSNFLGISAQFDHPKFLRAVERLVAAAKKHRKALGFMSADESWSREYWNRGFRMFAAGVDCHLYQAALRRELAVLEGLGKRVRR